MWTSNHYDTMNAFNPSRLRLARQRRALTRTRLAERSGVSLRSLTNYENGSITPSDEMIRRIADALSTPPGFFARETMDNIPTTAVSFRKLSKASAARRDAVLADARLTVEFFGIIESRFRLPSPQIPVLDGFAPENAAEIVRRRWSLGDRPIKNMVHLLEAKGVRFAALNHEHDDIDAFCLIRDGTPYIFLNTSKSAERQRFDVAHELGHLVLHGEQEMRLDESKKRETEANRFAASLLMPDSGVFSQSMRNASVDRILAARSFWTVSAMAMTHRLHELDLLSAWQYRSICMELSDRGYRSSEPGGVVPEGSQLLRKVMYGSTNRVGVAEVARAMDLYQADVRDFIRGLVPTAI